KENKHTRVWKISDYILECPFDVRVNFIKNTFAITDLDKDSIPEVWVMYQIACQKPATPADMKIVMYEGNQQFSMSGTSKIQISNVEFAGGNYTVDSNFHNNPVFRRYAES